MLQLDLTRLFASHLTFNNMAFVVLSDCCCILRRRVSLFFAVTHRTAEILDSIAEIATAVKTENNMLRKAIIMTQDDEEEAAEPEAVAPSLRGSASRGAGGAAWQPPQCDPWAEYRANTAWSPQSLELPQWCPGRRLGLPADRQLGRPVDQPVPRAGPKGH